MTRSIIVSTSTSGLDYWPEPHGIRMLRLHIQIGEHDYLEGLGMQADEFHQWMLNNPREMAVTSPPTREEVFAFFKQLLQEGYEQALVLTLSSKISKTHEVVASVAPLFKDKLKIWLFDTLSAAHGEARLALEADRALQRGQSIPGIVSRLHLLRSQQRIFITIGKLDYLIKAGRLSAPAGFLANLAQIRPILHITDGAVQPYDRVRTLERALDTMIGAALSFAGDGPCKMHAIQFGVESTNTLLLDLLREKYNINSVRLSPMTPVIAAHGGPDGASLLVWRV